MLVMLCCRSSQGSSNMAPAEPAKTGGFDHACRMCGMLFPTHELNVQHMMGHLRGYLCMQCGARFSLGRDIVGHLDQCPAAETEADEAKPQPLAQPSLAQSQPDDPKPKPRRRQPRPKSKSKSQPREPVRFIEQIDLVSESDSGHEGDGSPAGWPATPEGPGGSGDEDLVPVSREPLGLPAEAFEVIAEAAEAADDDAASSQDASAARDPLEEAPEASWRLRRHSDSVVVKTMERPETLPKKIVASRLSCPGTLCGCPPNALEPAAPVASSRPGPASRKRRLDPALEPPRLEPSVVPAVASSVSVRVKEGSQLLPRRRQGQREAH